MIFFHSIGILKKYFQGTSANTMSEEEMGENIYWQTISGKYNHDRRTLTTEDFSAETDTID